MKNNSRKGFTLIELLAVIVILGLLMAIAIPSITKYINQSRKKTVVDTIGNYVSAVTTAVTDGQYDFAPDVIYAIPIECILIEKGGSSTPWGEWFQPDENNGQTKSWAYVLVQYDGNNSYTYGFTFKDDSGYGLNPIAYNELNKSGNDIKAGSKLDFPTSGGARTNMDPEGAWKGFKVHRKDDTYLDANGNVQTYGEETIVQVFVPHESSDKVTTCKRVQN